MLQLPWLREFSLVYVIIIGSNTVYSKSWERKCSTNATYGVSVITQVVGTYPECPVICYKHSSCQMFTFSQSTGTCNGYSAFASEAVNGLSTEMLDYFVPVDTIVYTFDTVWNVTFAVYKTKKNWHDAKEVCTTDGGRLLTLDNKNKANIKSHIDDDVYWIGLSDTASENVWVWENGEQFNTNDWTFMFNDYDAGAPGNKRFHADCASWSTSSSTLNDNSCSAREFYFICEKSTLIL